MIFRYHQSLVPILVLIIVIAVASFNNGFMTAFSTINDISPSENPYLDEMYFENDNQKQEYQKGWFIQMSKRVVVYLMDDVPYEFVMDIEQQAKHLRERKESDDKYVEGKLTKIGQMLNKEPDNSVLLIQRAESYTITTTRVKTFGTGFIPGVIDAYNHVGQTEVTVDHFFRHTRAENQTTQLFGTETWDKFFGSYIDRVSTIAIGDSNNHVTQSPIIQQQIVSMLSQDNNEKDWNLLLFHDSSFDIVMHKGEPFQYAQPFSNPVFNQAMNNLNNGATNIIDATKDKDQTLIIMSDHGFTKQRGEHGGVSEDEAKAFIYFYNQNGFIKDKKIGQVMDRETLKTNVNQIDFVSTLCMLKGVAIPSNNIGAIIPDAFVNIPWVTNTYIANCYYVNLRQLEDFFKKSYAQYEFPKKESAEQIVKLMEEGRVMYKKLFAHKSKKQVQTDDYQPKDEELEEFIKHVRLVSNTMKSIYVAESDIFYPQMQLGVATVIVLVLFIAVIQFGLDVMISKNIQPHVIQPSKAAIHITTSVILLASVIILVSVYFVRRYLMVANIIAFIFTIFLIGYSIVFAIKLSKRLTSPKLSILNQNFQFTFRPDAQTAIFLALAGTYPIFLTSNDFIYALDSIFMLVLCEVLLLISIHAAYITLKGCKNNIVPVIARGLAIVCMLHFTIYYDPKLISNSGQIEYRKLFINRENLVYLVQPLFSTYLPLSAFSIFYVFVISKATKSLRSIISAGQSPETTTKQIQKTHISIWALNMTHLFLCVLYFSLKPHFQDNKYFFDNFFPISSYFIIAAQLLLFTFQSPPEVTFLQKYKLFFWSLVPPFLYLMEHHSVIQVVTFFTIIFLFQDIMRILNYRQHLLLHLILNIMCMSFYVSSGHGYRLYQVKFTTSHLGMVFFNELQVTLNVFISNLSWFVFTILYMPILLERDVKQVNSSGQISVSKSKPAERKDMEIQLQNQSFDYVQVSEGDGQETSEEIKINVSENGENGLESNDKNCLISSSNAFQIKLTQNFCQFILFYVVAFIPNFFHNIFSGYNPQTDLFTFIILVQLALVVLTLIFFILNSVLGKKFFASVVKTRTQYNIKAF